MCCESLSYSGGEPPRVRPHGERVCRLFQFLYRRQESVQEGGQRHQLYDLALKPQVQSQFSERGLPSITLCLIAPAFMRTFLQLLICRTRVNCVGSC